MNERNERKVLAETLLLGKQGWAERDAIAHRPQLEQPTLQLSESEHGSDSASWL